MAKVYIKTDSSSRIIAVDSDMFLSDTQGWTYIEEGYGDKFTLAREYYLPNGVRNENGVCLYKLQDGTALERTSEEIAGDTVTPRAVSTTHVLLSDIFDSRTVYVSPTGSDTTGDGTSGAPWATFQHAVEECPAFQGSASWTIYFSAGTYAGAAITGRRVFLTHATGASVSFSSCVTAAQGANVYVEKDFVFDGGSAAAFIASYGAFVYFAAVQAFKTTSADGCALKAESGARITAGGGPLSFDCVYGAVQAAAGASIRAGTLGAMALEEDTLTHSIVVSGCGEVLCAESQLSGTVSVSTGGRAGIGSTYYPAP